jgi:Fe-Mn family superoxide dismutase
MRGIGWAILYYDPKGDRFFNCWVNEHDMGHLAGCKPLLVMDVFEHAFIIDYGTKRAEYIAAFMKAVDWKKVEERMG